MEEKGGKPPSGRRRKNRRKKLKWKDGKKKEKNIFYTFIPSL
jgi:hypothetical protein